MESVSDLVSLQSLNHVYDFVDKFHKSKKKLLLYVDLHHLPNYQDLIYNTNLLGVAEVNRRWKEKYAKS